MMLGVAVIKILKAPRVLMVSIISTIAAPQRHSSIEETVMQPKIILELGWTDIICPKS